MGSKHTPGPWKTDGDEIILSSDGRNLADVWTEFAAIPRDEAVANARLIAAAPELLEALPALIVIALDSLDGMDAETREECERDIAKARAAIAKATGK